MAQILFRHSARPHGTTGQRTRRYVGGDCVAVLPDGAELGRDVDPDTAPANTPFVVVVVPGPRSDYLYLLDIWKGPMQIQNDPTLPEFGEEMEAYIAKRRYRLRRSLLANPSGNRWDRVVSGQRRERVGISQAAMEAAIIDKRTGNPIDPLTVPRGRKR